MYYVVKRFLAPFRSAIISSCEAFSQFTSTFKSFENYFFFFFFFFFVKNTCISSIDVSV